MGIQHPGGQTEVAMVTLATSAVCAALWGTGLLLIPAAIGWWLFMSPLLLAVLAIVIVEITRSRHAAPVDPARQRPESGRS